MDTEQEIPDLLAVDESRSARDVIHDDGCQPNVHDQLEQFRQQWKEELNDDECNLNTTETEAERTEKEARKWFMMGSKLEQEGLLYKAVDCYRKAMHLVPDIEMKIELSVRIPRERQESESSVDSYDGDLDEELDLITKFHNLDIEEYKLCTPNFQQRMSCHISALPLEVLIYIFKWVVTSQLDMKSLENISQVCRGFYLCARDEELWRLASLRVWGTNTGKVKKYGSWRNMYIQRPHLQFVGCYISRMSYSRQGERSLDRFYNPWHQVEYYRYFRFFSEGTVLMTTSPEDPQVTVPKLKSKQSKVPGMMIGIYRLSGNRVTGVLKRVKLPETKSYYKHKRNKNQIQNESKQTFNIELELQNVGKRNGYRLIWISYSVRTSYKGSGEESVADFEVNNKSYPPLVFSHVKNYSMATDSLLRL